MGDVSGDVGFGFGELLWFGHIWVSHKPQALGSG